MANAVIALIGRANAGKTSTLNKLAERIIKEYGAKRLIVKTQRISAGYPEKNSELTDRSYVLVVGRTAIGISTAGDSSELISSYCRPLLGSDVIITAARSENAVKKAFSEMGITNPNLVCIEKHDPDAITIDTLLQAIAVFFTDEK